MKGAIDLAKSERGVIALLVIACATVLVCVGKIDADHWTAIVKWTMIATVASKTFRSSSDSDDADVDADPIPVAKIVDDGKKG